MHTTVYMCSTPLVPEALPAVKTRYYARDTALPHIYCTARFYFLRGGLSLSLCAFEREPSPGSCIAFALCCEGDGGRLLLCTLYPGRSGVYLRPRNSPAALPGGEAALPYRVCERFSGGDEQGVYLGGAFLLPASLLAGAGLAPRPGSVYRAALTKYEGDVLQGASHAGNAADSRLFDTFEVVQTN